MMEGDNAGRTHEGEVSRLESLYHRYAGVVYTICLRLLANVQRAEEATVSVFVRFGREIERWLDELRVVARLRELAITDALSRLNVIGRKAETTAPSIWPGMTPIQASALKSKSRAPLDSATLDRLAAQLPDQLRVAFVLSDREGLSNRAIAAHLQIDEEEARRLIRMARLRLRQLWRESN